MRSLLISFALTALCALVLADVASAQVRRLPNTGCPNAPFPQVVGQPAIGQGFGVIVPPCRTAGGREFVILGHGGGPAVIAPPLACMRGCVLASRPIDIVPGSAWRGQIPNDPRLVGLCFQVQGGCIERAPAGPCVVLSGALQVCITR